MPNFFYKAKRGPKETVEGMIEAETLERAIDKVVKLGLSPIDVSANIKKKDLITKKQKDTSFSISRRIKSQDIVFFTRQLCDLLEAGVPLLQSLNIVHRQVGNPAFKEILEQMRSLVQGGSTLSDALARYPQAFSRLYISMVRSGELSGNLDLVLKRLADFGEKDQETRAKVRSSLIYPALMLIVGTITIFVLLTFVIPRLTTMFDDLGQSLPLITRILINISGFFENFWLIVFLVLLLTGYYSYKYVTSPEGKLWFDRFKLKIPLLGNFIRDVEIGRFARTLGTLLDSGVVIVQALGSVWAVLDNEVIRREIKKCAEEVAAGASLSSALKKNPYFPETAMSMIAVGEESGRLEQSLHKLADTYERHSDQAVKSVASLLEPLLIVFIGSVVGFIVIAMLLPIFQMNLIIR